MRHVCRCVIVAAVAWFPSATAVAQQGGGSMSARGPQFLVATTARTAPAVADVTKIPVLKRRIAVDLRGATLETALAIIGRTSGLSFVYGEDVVPVAERVHLKADEISVAAAASWAAARF